MPILLTVLLIGTLAATELCRASREPGVTRPGWAAELAVAGLTGAIAMVFVLRVLTLLDG